MLKIIVLIRIDYYLPGAYAGGLYDSYYCTCCAYTGALYDSYC